MLKRLLVLMLCSYFYLCLNAQDTFKPTTHLGIHGGFNLSSVNFVNPTRRIEQRQLTSEAYGIVIRHVSEPHIGIQLEVNYAGKGWKEVIDSVSFYTRKLETLDIPMYAVFIAGSRTFRVAFTIGPYVSYYRHEKEILTTTDTSKYEPYFFKPLVSKWEFGLSGGAGVEFHTGLGSFALRASYSYGFTNLFPLNEKEYYFSRSRNSVVHVGLMYFITF